MIKAETELYIPIKEFFEKNGFEVKAEVKGCDLAAVKADVLLIAELKKSFNLKLVYQVLERKSLTPYVYAVIPRPKSFKEKNVKMMLKLLKEIKVGLITVGVESKFKPVDVVLEPESGKVKNNNKRKIILKEFNSRKTDFNLGGAKSSKKIITAYRESSVEIACLAEKFGELTTKMARELSSAQKPESILRTNFYGWFDKAGRGIYILSKDGLNALEDKDLSELVEFYRKEVRNKDV